MPPASTRCETSRRQWSLRGTIRAVLQACRARWERDRAARTLSGLSDHMLIDMGISRSEAHGLVYRHATDAARRRDDPAA